MKGNCELGQVDAYEFGYLGEQVAIGILTGGTVTIAQVVAKGGAVLAGNLSAKALVQIAARSHLLKKQLATVTLSIELRLAIERGLVQATKMPVFSTILDSAGVVLETQLARPGFDRSLFNLRTLVEAAVGKSNTRRLFEQTGTEWVLFHRFALSMRLLGSNADPALLNNLLRIFDERLVITEAGVTFDWTEDFLRCFKGNPAEFVSRPPLDPFGEDAVAQLRRLCDSPDVGYIWKLDDEVPEGLWLRGILAELDLYYHEYRTWTHLPVSEPVLKMADLTGLAG